MRIKVHGGARHRNESHHPGIGVYERCRRAAGALRVGAVRQGRRHECFYRFPCRVVTTPRGHGEAIENDRRTADCFDLRIYISFIAGFITIGATGQSASAVPADLAEIFLLPGFSASYKQLVDNVLRMKLQPQKYFETANFEKWPMGGQPLGSTHDPRAVRTRRGTAALADSLGVFVDITAVAAIGCCCNSFPIVAGAVLKSDVVNRIDVGAA